MKIFKLFIYAVLYLVTFGMVASCLILTPHPLEGTLITILRAIIVFFASVLLTKYTVYMVISPFCGLMARREKKLVSYFIKDYQPLVSVMIPAWNEEVGLIPTIKTLLASTYKRLEIVVVNDGSTDTSHALMMQFLTKYYREMAGIPTDERIQILYRYQPNGGKGSALNTAIWLSHGDILISIDADCIVDEKAVESFVDAFRDPRTMAAVGCVRIGNTKTIIGTIQYIEYLLGFYFKKCDSVLNTIYVIGGAAGAFRREVFQKLGGYSTTNITEDIELSTRVQEQGWKIVYCPDAIVHTEGASTIKGLMKQRLRWKRGRFQTFWQHRNFFFSLKPSHNKLLTWIILPLAVFGDTQIGFEPTFIITLYVFSWLSHDFAAFLSGIFVVFVMFLVQAWDSRGQEGMGRTLLLAPVGWSLFYLTTAIEWYALIMSLWLMVSGRELKWQRWNRKGVIDQ